MPSNRPGLQRLASAELRARTILKFKEASQQHQEIESRAEFLKLFLEDKYPRFHERADRVEISDDSNEK
jgi:hypothetical protein